MTSTPQPPPGDNQPWQQYPPTQQYGPPAGSPPPYGYPQQPAGQAPQGYPQQQPGYPQHQPGYGPPPGNPYGPQYYSAQQFPKPTGWFVVNWLFFWPLAIYSLISAWGNIDRALFAGDMAGAQFQADRVKKFGIIALCIGIGWIVLWIVIAAAATTAACTGYGC
ncbi:MAG: Interferon-induced transrane protein [Jatrophihabitans sp.]|jgi:hypothetical protein|nr:Interferon-induced transrane protein [Jatrophihabitans sp.]MCW2656260.1 Interferon-induced transrane protein [Jatrophihabitans sp.]